MSDPKNPESEAENLQSADVSETDTNDSVAQLPPAEPPRQAEPVAAAPAKAKKSLLWIPVFLNFLLTLVLIGGIAYGAWWLKPQWQAQQSGLKAVEQQQSTEKDSVADAKQAIEQSIASISEMREANSSSLAQSQEATEATLAELREELGSELRAITERVNAHNQRLLSLSNTSREDWMLAEANYLLRLASQRLLVDRQATSALGLMEAVDGILQELAMPDLFSVRKALSRDLGAVRLAAEVDREGIYLRLDGLIHNMEQVPLFDNPLAKKIDFAELEKTAPPATEEAPADFWMQAVNWTKQQASLTGERLSQYFVVQRHDHTQSALLAPSQEGYLRQNVRLSLEQAQVAMLREQDDIYAASLKQAIDMVERFFPESPARTALVEEITMLQGRPIAVDLPQIDNSIEQLEAYIERLHQLEGNGEEP